MRIDQPGERRARDDPGFAITILEDRGRDSIAAIVAARISAA